MVFIPGNSLPLDNSGIHWTIGKYPCLTGSGSCLAVFGGVCVCAAGTVSSTRYVAPRFDSGNKTGGTFIWGSFLSSGSGLVTVAAFSCEERASSVCMCFYSRGARAALLREAWFCLRCAVAPTLQGNSAWSLFWDGWDSQFGLYWIL